MTTYLAKALYDNIAESPDELAFQKGDTLIILEQNTNNLQGWWLCSLRGRQGLCPGNRLRVIPAVFNEDPRANCVFPIPNDLNLLQQQGKRRSWHVQPNKVVTPKKFKDVYLYDNPHSLTQQEGGGEFYDIPKPTNQKINMAAENYDIPRSHQSQLTPSSSTSSLTNDSLTSSNRNSVANIPEYDIPKPHLKTLNTPNQIYDIPASQKLKELPLDLNCALETLEKLHTEISSSVNKILQLTSHQNAVNNKNNIETYQMDVKLSIIRLKTSLHDFTEFSERILGNAAKITDKSIINKLIPLVDSLKKSDYVIGNFCFKLQDECWFKNLLLSYADNAENLEEFDCLISCSRALTDEIRQISSFIQGNAPLLFKKPKIENFTGNCHAGNNITGNYTAGNCTGNCNVGNEFKGSCNHGNDFGADYDYVRLDDKNKVLNEQNAISNELPVELRKKYNNLIEVSENASLENENCVSESEKDILIFYASQMVNHHKNLTQAIDAFLLTVEHNQPPKIFLAHAKFVILSAHKLISIGDAVHKSLTYPDIKINSLNCANALSASLAANVAKTRMAAQQFPSVSAVQEMVDSVVDISHSARDLKLCLIQASQPYC